jgi:hypothetical protein
MQRKFEPGEVFVSPEVEELLARTGQDAEFFLEKHFCGDWGEQRTALNEEGFRTRKIVVSVFRTLRGVRVWVFTNFEKNRTYVDCMSVTDSVFDPTVICSSAQAETSTDRLTISDEHGGPSCANPGMEVPPDVRHSYPVLLGNDELILTDPKEQPLMNDGFHYTISDGNSEDLPPVGIVEPPLSFPRSGDDQAPTVIYTPTQPQINADQVTYTISDGYGGVSCAIPAVQVPDPTDEPDYGPGAVLISNDTSTVSDSIPPVDMVVPPASPETGTADGVEEPGKQP